MTEQLLPLSPLPPHPLIRELGERFLEPGVRRTILDAGAGNGRNTQYLLNLGHTVVALDLAMPELRALQPELSIEEEGKEDDVPTPNLHLVAGKAQKLPFGTVFDIACMNELNLQMPRTATYAALTELRRVTVQGGLNVVSGYLLFPGEGTEENKAQAFRPGELRGNYQSTGWIVLHYLEEQRPLQYGATGKEFISSLSMIIAQRPWGLERTSE